MASLVGQGLRQRGVAALLLGALLLGALFAAVPSSAPAAAATSRSPTTLTVLSQSPDFLDVGGTLSLELSFRSPLPPSDLGIQVALYPTIANFGSFSSGTNASPAQVLPATGAFPVTDGLAHRTALTFAFATSATATTRAGPEGTLSLPCSDGGCFGVYPLVVHLVDRSDQDRRLASLTTHFIFVSHVATVPVRVAVVLPLGSAPALAPGGTTALSAAAVASLQALVTALNASGRAHVSLAVYPQLLLALSNAPHLAGAREALDALTRLVTTRRHDATLGLLRTTFAPVDPSELALPSLAQELDNQFQVAASSLARYFGTTLAGAPYLSTTALTSAGLAALEQEGVKRLLLPADSVALGNSYLQTAPFRLLTTASPAVASAPSALGYYSALDSYLEHPGDDPVLAAHELLAELAQLYFDRPSGAQPRAVLLAPATLPRNGRTLRTMLTTLLEGFDAGPVLRSATVQSVFGTVPFGADGVNVTAATLTTTTPAHTLDTAAITNARHQLLEYQIIAPEDSSGFAHLRNALLLSEGVALTPAARARYLDPERHLLGAIGATLSVSSSRRVTVTARTGQIPVIIKTRWSALPLHFELRLRSSALLFPGVKAGARPVVLDHTDNTETIKVSSRTSGDFNLDLDLTTPDGSAVLLRSSMTLRSTAISGAAIALSIGALAVLVLWWLRSILSGRRRRAGLHTRHEER